MQATQLILIDGKPEDAASSTAAKDAQQAKETCEAMQRKLVGISEAVVGQGRAIRDLRTAQFKEPPSQAVGMPVRKCQLCKN